MLLFLAGDVIPLPIRHDPDTVLVAEQIAWFSVNLTAEPSTHFSHFSTSRKSVSPIQAPADPAIYNTGMFVMIYSIFYFYFIKYMAHIIFIGNFKKRILLTELSMIFKKSQINFYEKIKDKTRKIHF